jgi:hypothetical protein
MVTPTPSRRPTTRYKRRSRITSSKPSPTGPWILLKPSSSYDIPMSDYEPPKPKPKVEQELMKSAQKYAREIEEAERQKAQARAQAQQQIAHPVSNGNGNANGTAPKTNRPAVQGLSNGHSGDYKPATTKNH